MLRMQAFSASLRKVGTPSAMSPRFQMALQGFGSLIMAKRLVVEKNGTTGIARGGTKNSEAAVVVGAVK